MLYYLVAKRKDSNLNREGADWSRLAVCLCAKVPFGMALLILSIFE